MDFDKFGKYILIAICVILSLYIEQIDAVNNEDVDNLLAFFDKPQLPLVNPKANRYFELPESYHDENYQELTAAAPERDPNLSIVKIKELSALPNLDDILSLDRNESFSLYVPRHRDIAAKLIDIFLDVEDTKDFISLLSYIQHRVNPQLFIYALSVALMNRNDTKGQNFPNNVQLFPDKYFNKESFKQIEEKTQNAVPEFKDPIEILLQRTSSDFDIEQKMAYWREDIGANLHHWHWHLANPHKGKVARRQKDRRGELFYYMHQQVVARYNIERICNNLEPVQRYTHWSTPIQEESFSEQGDFVDSNLLNDPFIPNDMVFENVAIPSGNFQMDIANLIRHRDRICRTIDLGYAVAKNGTKIELNNVIGIDILGNMVESNELSIDYNFYGDFHNFGHLLISVVLEPPNADFETPGVMRDPSTAMRDPIFYRWHSYINGIFEKFKETLRPYTVDELDYPGIKVTSASINTDGQESANVFSTFWSTTILNLKHGLNFLMRRENVLVKYEHLQHRNFTYQITVDNESDRVKQGTCRVFLSPANDEKSIPWERLADQRHMFVELDKFKVELRPGSNIIIRNSMSSTVTIPFQQTFYDLEQRPPDDSDASISFHYSGCGWPHHLLIPIGTEEGYPSQLFVMITNYEEDEVEDTNMNRIGETYCGIRGSKYPDKKAMGFPFDRLPRGDDINLEQFLTPNMFVQNCIIKHSNLVVEPQLSKKEFATSMLD